MGSIYTWHGHKLDPERPSMCAIDSRDIARRLSVIPRFGGDLSTSFTVLQHSILVASFVPPQHRVRALLHDASEAYIADIASPFKSSPSMHGYRRVEAKLMKAIHYCLLPIREKINPEIAEQYVHLADWLSAYLEIRHWGCRRLREEWLPVQRPKPSGTGSLTQPPNSRAVYRRLLGPHADLQWRMFGRQWEAQSCWGRSVVERWMQEGTAHA